MKEKLKDLMSLTLLEELLQSSKTCLALQFGEAGELELTDSKAGGIGYLPASQAYPRNLETGAPLFLLAQLNFAQLPSLADYPEQGILAFYVDYGDDLLGLNFAEPVQQTGFRVLFFEGALEASHSREQQLAWQKDVAEELYPVVAGEYRISGTEKTDYLCSEHYEFQQYFGKSFYEWLSETAGEESRKKLFDVLYEAAAGSKIGGYPYFTQEDPRLQAEKSRYDTLLFQLDTEKIGNDWPIMWGDMGVGNFFIAKTALKNRDFTDVQYNWDCG